MGFTNADIIRAAARYDHLTYCKAAFFWAYRRPMKVTTHILLICKVVDEILEGKRTRVLINMPPRMGKTELFVIMLSSRIFAVNPSARNMHLSYSQNLVVKNSIKTKTVIKTPQYASFFPDVCISKDTEGWWTTTESGEFYATTTSGQVTGFECGMSGDPFDGMLMIDDPQKSKGAMSAKDRSNMKDVVGDAISTRLNHDFTPVLVVQQRLHLDDISAWLLSGGTGDIWDTLVLQGLSEDGRPPEHYLKYSHCNLLNYQRPPGALWPARKSEEALIRIREARESNDQDEPRGARAFAAQYQQSPADSKISLFESGWIQDYREHEIPPTISEIFIRIDTAQKGEGKSDHNGIVLFGVDKRDRSRVYVLDALRKRCEFPDLIDWVFDYIERTHALQSQSINFTRVTIEDANIGAALKSTLAVRLKASPVRVAIELTEKYHNKFDRAMEALPYLQQGRVYMPIERTKFVEDYSMEGLEILRTEYKEFNLADTHASDDILDCVIWEVVTRWGDAPGSDRFVYRGFA